MDNTGTADDNELTVEAVSVRKAYGGYVEGFFSKGTQANFNTLTIKGTDTDSVRFAYGGYSERGPVAKENKVFIDGASVGHAYGGYILYDGDATDNTVTLTSGSVEDMTAGFAYGSGNATRNKAFINGGTVITEVSGGYAEEGNATGNTVTLAGGEVKGSVWGGECKLPSGTCDAVTGNTLNVQTKGMKVGGDVANFDTLSFDLDTIGAGDTVLDVGGTADFSKVSSAKFSFKLADGAALKPGDTITLIKAGDLQIPSLPTSVTVCGHDFELLTTATTLTATVKEPAPTPNPTPTPQPYYYGGGDSSSPTLGELGLLLSGLALAGAAAPALRRREKLGKKD